jgi:hypothetical protein
MVNGHTTINWIEGICLLCFIKYYTVLIANYSSYTTLETPYPQNPSVMRVKSAWPAGSRSSVKSKHNPYHLFTLTQRYCRICSFAG